MPKLWMRYQDGWRACPPEELPPLGLRVLAVPEAATASMAVIAAARVPLYANGQRLHGGLRVLEHRDELMVGGTRLAYSAHALPVVADYRGGAAGARCPICRVALEVGDAVVACPGCGRAYHQREDKPCYTYAETCRFCAHPTSLSPDSEWRPEQEEG